VQAYNTTVRQFPTNLTAMLFKMDVKPNFTVENEAAISAPPKVDFGKTPAPPATPPAAPKTSVAPGTKTAEAPADAAAELMKKGY
jgi:LemA protein